MQIRKVLLTALKQTIRIETPSHPFFRVLEEQLGHPSKPNLHQFRLHRNQASANSLRSSMGSPHRIQREIESRPTRSLTPASLTPPLPSENPFHILSKSPTVESIAALYSPRAMISGPRVRMAVSSAGVPGMDWMGVRGGSRE